MRDTLYCMWLSYQTARAYGFTHLRALRFAWWYYKFDREAEKRGLWKKLEENEQQ